MVVCDGDMVMGVKEVVLVMQGRDSWWRFRRYGESYGDVSGGGDNDGRGGEEGVIDGDMVMAVKEVDGWWRYRRYGDRYGNVGTVMEVEAEIMMEW